MRPEYCRPVTGVNGGSPRTSQPSQVLPEKRTGSLVPIDGSLSAHALSFPPDYSRRPSCEKTTLSPNIVSEKPEPKQNSATGQTFPTHPHFQTSSWRTGCGDRTLRGWREHQLGQPFQTTAQSSGRCQEPAIRLLAAHPREPARVPSRDGQIPHTSGYFLLLLLSRLALTCASSTSHSLRPATSSRGACDASPAFPPPTGTSSSAQ